LLVISGLCIYAVEDTPKKIKDLGVFFVTSVFSLWAYIWLFLVLNTFSKDAVDITEAIVTLVFGVLLIVIAFAADKINEYVEDTKKSQEEIEEDSRKDELKIKKGDLRNIAKIYGDNTVVEIVQGISTSGTDGTPKHVHEDIIHLYKMILDVDDPKSVDINTLLEQLQPEALLEKFAYRNKGASNKEFIKLKGTKG
jgi:solute carrier family 8 (sodium/calcium exchanger)